MHGYDVMKNRIIDYGSRQHRIILHLWCRLDSRIDSALHDGPAESDDVEVADPAVAGHVVKEQANAFVAPYWHVATTPDADDERVNMQVKVVPVPGADQPETGESQRAADLFQGWRGDNIVESIGEGKAIENNTEGGFDRYSWRREETKKVMR